MSFWQKLNPALSAGDFWVVGLYFSLIFGIAYFIYRQNRRGGQDQSQDYFLGGKNLGWFVIGASLFASNIGSEHLIGLTGAGAAGKFPAAQFEILASLLLMLLAWLFVPFYLRTGVYTMPEFLERRYDAWARRYLSWLSILAYILTKISVTIAAGGIIFTVLLGIDFWFGAIAVVLATGLYTALGGMRAVMYTDLAQMFILLGAALALGYYGWQALGGWEAIAPVGKPEYLSLWRSADDPDFPWTGILLGAPILGVWYWCTDQFIVQRVLSAKDLQQARRGSLFAGYLKLLPLFLFVIPGVMAYSLSLGPDPLLVFPSIGGEVAYDSALPLLTMELLPSGLRGLVIAGMLAALMSSLSSVFNSCSTLFTLDIYQKYRPQSSEGHLVVVGRWVTLALIVLGLLWIPLLQRLEGGLFQKLQSLQSYISPPIAAVFLWGLFAKRLEARGAKYALLLGAVLGSLRLALELCQCRLPGWLAPFVEMNFLHFAFFLFVLCTAVLFGVSYFFAPKNPALSTFLCLQWNGGPAKSAYRDIALSLLLFALVLGLWLFFN